MEPLRTRPMRAGPRLDDSRGPSTCLSRVADVSRHEPELGRERTGAASSPLCQCPAGARLFTAASLGKIGTVDAADDPYPEIGNILSRCAGRKPWERIELYVSHGKGRGQYMAAATFPGGGERDLRIDDVFQLHELFDQVRKVARPVGASGRSDWTTARFTLMRDGTSAIEFGFEPLPSE